jgi:drug/metabolite transporter (DMT)-like permease
MTTIRRTLMLIALCIIWGSTWLVIKVGLEVLPPFLGAALRFGVASIVLFGLALVRGVPFPTTPRTHLGLLGVGLVGIGLSYGVVYWGEQYIPSGLSAVLFATHPLFVMGIAHVAIAAEPITPRKAFGAVISFVGVVLIFRTDLQFTHPLGLIAAFVTLLSPIAAASSNVAIKRWGHHIHPYNLTAFPMGYATIFLGTASVMTEDLSAVAWSWTGALSVLYLALFGSVAAFVMLYTLLKQVPVSLLALISYAFPVVAVALGFLILGETLEPQAIAGALAIVAGIATATSRRA